MNPSLSVFYSEFVLSLYPILIKTVDTNIFSQLLARFFVFPALALVFGSSKDFMMVWSNPYESVVGVLNGLMNLGHIAVSYLSFKNLPAGTAISLFYLYPIFNVIAGSILFGEKMTLTMILLIGVAFIGTYLIATSRDKKEGLEEDKKGKYKMGVIMGILAALTETMIFIFVRWNKEATKSPFYTVNHLYPAGLLLLGGYALMNKSIVDTSKWNWIKLLGFNGLLGFTGYIARFYAIPKVPTIVFSLLSFVGVGFGYIWGMLFTEDQPTSRAIIGGGLIASTIAILRYLGSN
jgi:drug/metabolite transporter (DMT)-like permease